MDAHLGCDFNKPVSTGVSRALNLIQIHSIYIDLMKIPKNCFVMLQID